jgi:choline kinase/putative flippase GtrA
VSDRYEVGLPPVCILAGGLGTRLGTQVREIPKPLIEVAGSPFLVHQLRLLAAHGFTRVVLCVGYLGELIEREIGSARDGISIAYSYDAPGLDGTLGAIRRARPLLGERFLVLYGDTYLRIDYRAVAESWRTGGRPAVMTVLRNQGRWDASNVVLRDGMVVRYDKARPNPEMEWIDYGLGGLTDEALEIAPASERDLSALYRSLAERGELMGFVAEERFYEIGSPAALAETDAFLRGLVERENVPGRLRSMIAYLRSPRSGLLGQLVRFGLVGGTVALLYLTVTTVLSQVFGLPFQLALAIGFASGLLAHFTLQRVFVWAHHEEFALGLGHQVRRYLTMALSQYGVTAVATAVLPGLLGVAEEVAYLMAMAVVTTAGFLLMRFVIFHGDSVARSDAVSSS